MSKYLSEVRSNLEEGTVTTLKDKDLIVKNGGSVPEDYWRAMYQNIARADVNRAQIKQLMFVYSKIKICARSERPDDYRRQVHKWSVTKGLAQRQPPPPLVTTANSGSKI